jgi:hypothetical protein
MLSLQKSEDAVAIIGIFKGTKGNKRRKPHATVYFTHADDEMHGNVAPAKGVLQLHKNAIKKQLHINDREFDEICEMLDSDDEPSDHPLKHQYWETRERFERYLKREMYLGDLTDERFELNFPRKKSDWPGTTTCIGSSGSGKTHFIVQMILRYWRSVEVHSRRPVVWISPELTLDKTLKPLRDNHAFDMWFHGIDISEKAVREHGGTGGYFKTVVQDKLESISEDAIVVFDDFPDSARALYADLERLYNSMLRVARHRNMGVISLIHTYASGKASSQALQSNKHVIFYPRSQQSRCIQFLRDYLQIKGNEAREMVQRFAKLDRWMCVQMHSPVCIFNSKYLVLL